MKGLVKGKGRYSAVFEPDEDHVWIVEIPEVYGCHSFGRTLTKARKNIREALAGFVDDAESAEIVEEIRLPRKARGAIERYRGARRKVERASGDVARTSREALEVLTRDLRRPVRDAAELLGMSKQRVSQLLSHHVYR